MKNFIKNYLLFSLLIISIMTGLIFITIETINIPVGIPRYPNKGWHYFFEILKNNLKNYLQYLVFPLAPILILKDCFCLSVGFAVSIFYQGLTKTFDRIWLHGLVEIPNILLYQFLSLRWLIICIKNKQIILFSYLIENYRWYLLSLILLALAAFLEGVF